MVLLAKAHGMEKGLQWLMEIGTTCVLPSLGIVDPEKTHLTKKQMGWGNVETIGVGTGTFLLPIIRQVPRRCPLFWNLPEEQQDNIGQRRQTLADIRSVQAEVPHVMYRRQSYGKRTANSDKLPLSKITRVTSKARRDTILDGSEDEETKEEDVDREIVPFSQRHSDQDDMVDGDDPWGTDFGLCVPKSFAVVNSVYMEGDFGISVVRVLILSSLIMFLMFF